MVNGALTPRRRLLRTLERQARVSWLAPLGPVHPDHRRQAEWQPPLHPATLSVQGVPTPALARVATERRRTRLAQRPAHALRGDPPVGTVETAALAGLERSAGYRRRCHA